MSKGAKCPFAGSGVNSALVRADTKELRRLAKRLRGLLPLPKLVARLAPGNATKAIAGCRGKRVGGKTPAGLSPCL